MLRNATLAALLLVTLAASAASAASAATRQKAGLWENSALLRMGDSMPQIDPMLLEQMRAMGMQIPFADPVINQVCITPAQAALDTIPNLNDPDSGCGTAKSTRSGDTVTAEVRCQGSMKGQGKVSMTLTSAESYKGTGNFRGTGPNGEPLDMATDFTGRWLGADCGSVQPYAP